MTSATILDLDVLHRLLHDNYKEMSRWDVYLIEVETGHLEWSAVHTEKFFQQNAKRMEGPDGDFRIVKVCAPSRSLLVGVRRNLCVFNRIILSYCTYRDWFN